MWVFAEKGFVSIVRHRDSAKTLLVRGRFHGDIEALFAEADVIETPDADYRFRTFLPRLYVARRMGELVQELTYPSFKDHIAHEDRKPLYASLWRAMATAQERALAIEPLPKRPAQATGPRAQRRAKRKRKSARLLGGLR